VTAHTILLSIDGALLVETDSPEREYAAYRVGDEYRPLTVPDDAVELEMKGPGDRGPYFYRPAVVDGLRALARSGADIVWNTRWLASPASLGELSRRLGLEGSVRVPSPAELPVAPADVRIDLGPNVLWEHWKVQALVQRVRDLPAGDELVVVDSVLDFSSRRLPDGAARRAHRNDVRIGGVKTYDQIGLNGRAIEALSDWIAGGPMPRL